MILELAAKWIFADHVENSKPIHEDDSLARGNLASLIKISTRTDFKAPSRKSGIYQP